MVAKHIRYGLTDKAIRARAKIFTWRAIASYDELAVMDVLARMGGRATRKALIRRMDIADNLLEQRELALNLRRLMKRGFVTRIVT